MGSTFPCPRDAAAAPSSGVASCLPTDHVAVRSTPPCTAARTGTSAKRTSAQPARPPPDNTSRNIVLSCLGLGGCTDSSPSSRPAGCRDPFAPVICVSYQTLCPADIPAQNRGAWLWANPVYTCGHERTGSDDDGEHNDYACGDGAAHPGRWRWPWVHPLPADTFRRAQLPLVWMICLAAWMPAHSW